MEPTWQVSEIDVELALRLSRELDLHPVTARCLVARGLREPSAAAAFLRPRLADLRPPGDLAGLAAAVERIVAAVRGGELVGLFGDYDVDGVSAAALLAVFLESVGGRVVARVARRDAGYGFTEGDATSLLERGCSLIVTLDCGTSDLASVGLARARGVDVIVVDHHELPEGEHPASALVNPHRADSTYPFRGLASVGLAFYVAAAVRTSLRTAGWFAARKEPDPRELLDLVALGTIADVAPLTGENRVLVAAGLAVLSARRRPGLAALLDRAGVERARDVTEVEVGWRLGPRMNAPGRLGDASTALRLLLARDLAEATELAAELEELNTRRRALQERVLAEALEAAAAHADQAAIVVAGASWHPGVVGIVAGKLADRLGKPAAVIALDPATGEGRGSVRAQGGFHVFRALSAASSHLLRHGGHAGAGGFSVAAGEVDGLRLALSREAERAEAVPSALVADADVGLEEVDRRLAAELARLGPFGAGNPEPLLVTRGARVRESRTVGEGGAHLKLTLASGRSGTSWRAVAFQLGGSDPGPGATVDVAYRPELSSWQGTERVELKVRALRPASG